MLQILLENKSLIFSEEGEPLKSIGFAPKVGSVGDMVKIEYLLEKVVFNRTLHFSEIEVVGYNCQSAVEVTSAITELCKVFNSESTGGDGMTPGQVANSIKEHNTDELAHKTLTVDLEHTDITLTPKPGGVYKYGVLNSITLQNVPSSLQAIIILFESGETPTEIDFGTLATAGDVVPKSNVLCELSIFNGLAVLIQSN